MHIKVETLFLLICKLSKKKKNIGNKTFIKWIKFGDSKISKICNKRKFYSVQIS